MYLHLTQLVRYLSAFSAWKWHFLLNQQMMLGKHMNRSVILLDLFTLAGTKLAALIFTGTKERIAKKFCTGISCTQKRSTSGAG